MTTTTITRNDTAQRHTAGLARRAVVALTTGCLDSDPGEIFAGDYRPYGPAHQVMSTRGAQDINALATAFSDRRVDIHDIQPSASGVAVRLTFRGRHTGTFQGTAPSGQEMQGDGVAVFSFRDGLIASGTCVLRWTPTN